MSLLSHTSAEVRAGASLGVGLVTSGVYNPAEDLALNTLYDALAAPFSPSASANAAHCSAAALLALALAYARTGREDVLAFVVKGLTDGTGEVAAAAAVAGGMVFCGQRQPAVIRAAKARLAGVKEETEEQLTNLVLGFGFALQFTVGAVVRCDA